MPDYEQFARLVWADLVSSTPPERCSDAADSRSAKALGDCRHPIVRFSRRDRHILRMLCQGNDAKEIADELEICLGTTHTHIRSLYRKAGLVCDRHLIVYAMQQPDALQPGTECHPGLHQVGADSCPYCQAMSKAA